MNYVEQRSVPVCFLMVASLPAHFSAYSNGSINISEEERKEDRQGGRESGHFGSLRFQQNGVLISYRTVSLRMSIKCFKMREEKPACLVRES